MNKRTINAALSAVTAATVMASIALADNVTLPTVFKSGTPARASEVNANFDAVKAAVDDNYARIVAADGKVATLQTTQATTTSDVTSLQTTQAKTTSDVAALQAAQTKTASDVTALKTAQTTTTSNVTALQTAQATTTSNVTALQTAQATTTSNVTALQTAQATTTSNVAALQTAQATTTSNVTALQTAQATTTSNMTALQTTVGRLAGTSNTDSAAYSVAVGGLGNKALGWWSTVVGGINNTASGVGSFAAGWGANAQYDGCFVWGDYDSNRAPSAPVSCDQGNQWMVYASGGVVFRSSSSGTSGVSLAPGGGAWNTLSDRNAKDSFVPVSPTEVLEKVVAMPVSSWAYKTEKGVTHLGPMAQDFYEAFKLGTDDRHISTVDAEGVALAAIQGLNAKTVALQQENAQLRAELDELKVRLAEVARGLRDHEGPPRP